MLKKKTCISSFGKTWQIWCQVLNALCLWGWHWSFLLWGGRTHLSLYKSAFFIMIMSWLWWWWSWLLNHRDHQYHQGQTDSVGTQAYRTISSPKRRSTLHSTIGVIIIITIIIVIYHWCHHQLFTCHHHHLPLVSSWALYLVIIIVIRLIQASNQKQKLCVLICYVLTSCLKQPQTQGFECLGCLHSCWSSLGTDGPQVTCNHTWPRKNSQLSMVNMVVCIHLAFWHREGLPLTMKSCFYPLIGDRIFGWPGDLVDILRCLQTSFCVQAFKLGLWRLLFLSLI